MKFSEVLVELENGAIAAREGWNGKGMYIFIVKGDSVKQALYEHYGDPETECPILDVCDAIYMKTADDKLVPWLASQTDIFADDWSIL